MSHFHDVLQFRDGLKHRDVVIFEEAIFKLPARLLSAAVSNRSADVYVRAAIEAGWIAAPKTESGKFGDEQRHFIEGVNIDDMEAGAVRYIGAEVAALYERLTSYPKN